MPVKQLSKKGLSKVPLPSIEDVTKIPNSNTNSDIISRLHICNGIKIYWDDDNSIPMPEQPFINKLVAALQANTLLKALKT